MSLTIGIKKFINGKWYDYPFTELNSHTVKEGLTAYDGQPIVVIVASEVDSFYLCGSEEILASMKRKNRKVMLFSELKELLEASCSPLLSVRLIAEFTSLFLRPESELFEEGEMPSEPPKTTESPTKKRVRSEVEEDDDARDVSWLTSQGARFIEQAEPLKAVPLLSQAIERDPSNFSAASLLGVAYERAGRREDALREFNRALMFNESHWQTWLYVGRLYAKQGELKQARHAFERALELNPGEKTIKRAFSGLRGVTKTAGQKDRRLRKAA